MDWEGRGRFKANMGPAKIVTGGMERRIQRWIRSRP